MNELETKNRLLATNLQQSEQAYQAKLAAADGRLQKVQRGSRLPAFFWGGGVGAWVHRSRALDVRRGLWQVRGTLASCHRGRPVASPRQAKPSQAKPSQVLAVTHCMPCTAEPMPGPGKGASCRHPSGSDESSVETGNCQGKSRGG
jgi:hypothetical protein